ncbi:MAG TPA: carboxymuconolactone decarboxylase family protein [Polyangiaceae bacterium]
MRLKAPRIAPVPESEWSPEVREMLEASRMRGRVPNIFSTFARHPVLMKSWIGFGRHILMSSTFPPRERELAILRIGWLCRAEYEWSQHSVIGKLCGLTDAEVSRVQIGPDAPEWGNGDRAVLRAVDELHGDAMIANATWAELSARFGTEQLMDLVFTVGQYQLVSMALNTFGVELDEGTQGFQGKVSGPDPER